MRRFILVTGCLAFTFTGAAVHATDCNVPKVACCPSCDAPTPQQCTCSRPAQPQPAATPQSGTRPAQGGYVTPPHRGTYAGETSSLGLDIGGIHVPEMHFHLPTLRLPGLRHLRRNPEFLGDAHTAPYVTAPISQFAGTPQAGTRPASPQPDEGTPKEQSGTRPSSCTVPKAPAAEAAEPKTPPPDRADDAAAGCCRNPRDSPGRSSDKAGRFISKPGCRSNSDGSAHPEFPVRIDSI